MQKLELLTIDLNTIVGINDPKAVEVLFVENMISENGIIINLKLT